MGFLDSIISLAFYSIFFFVPLVLYPFTSELFEFNKMVVVYFFTTIIVAAWIGKMILSKKFIFRRTIVDIPLFLFIFSQFMSTILSIDFRTSLLGYYSRFNGGFISIICYSLLYWAFVSNMTQKRTIRSILVLFISTILASIWGTLEHFGIDKNIWVQDVQLRVFSTFGQPNWLAAWLVVLIPVAWAFQLRGKNVFKVIPPWIFYFVTVLFLSVLIFTKSRSGFLGLATAWAIFWPFAFWKFKKEVIRPFVIIHVVIALLLVLFGTPLTPSIFELTSHGVKQTAVNLPGTTALETGGTESGTIRKIVWKGATDVWLHYPIFGTGVETFAFSYYQFRPVEHNLVSEWDFLYNKAHNEYLNFLANTGAFGLLTYLGFVLLAIYQMAAVHKNNTKNYFLHIALLAGSISLLVTNFFGFSVVPTQILLFLFPAFSVALEQTTNDIDPNENKLTNMQKTGLVLILCSMFYVLFSISKYWYADILYSRARSENQVGQYLNARTNSTQAISLSPHEAIFIDELSKSDTNLAILLSNDKKSDDAKKLAGIAIQESQLAQSLAPRNLNIKRDAASTFTKLAQIDPTYYQQAKDVLNQSIDYAPTDPKLRLNLAVVYLHLDQNEKAVETLKETINLKPNYKEARFAYAAILADAGKKQLALEQTNYILTKIDPNDQNTIDLQNEIQKK